MYLDTFHFEKKLKGFLLYFVRMILLYVASLVSINTAPDLQEDKMKS
jgi:hypothetical protein